MRENIINLNSALLADVGNDKNEELIPGMLLKLEVKQDVIAVVSPRPLRRHALSGGIYRNERENPTTIGKSPPKSKPGRIEADFAKSDSWAGSRMAPTVSLWQLFEGGTKQLCFFTYKYSKLLSSV